MRIKLQFVRQSLCIEGMHSVQCFFQRPQLECIAPESFLYEMLNPHVEPQLTETANGIVLATSLVYCSEGSSITTYTLGGGGSPLSRGARFQLANWDENSSS
jgi:hypothetical protein